MPDKRLNACAVILCAAILANAPRAQLAEPDDFPTFEKRVIDAEFAKGYQVSLADIDSDGTLEILALSTTPSKLVWYKNPGWERSVVTTTIPGNIDLAPYDVDGDSDTDLALASAFDLNDSTHGGDVQWLECPEDPAREKEWTAHPICAIPTAHRVRWADVSGDSRKELLVLPIIGVGARAPGDSVPVRFTACEIPANPREDAWRIVVLDETLTLAHGICVAKWGDDSGEDILTASMEGTTRFHRKAGEIVKQQIAAGKDGPPAKRGSSEVGYGRLRSADAQFVASIEPWHGSEVVAYLGDEATALSWPRTVIDTSFVDGHGLVCADLDRDGDDEIIAGHRGGEHNLFIYRFSPTDRKWNRIPIDLGGVSVAGLVTGDVNADGFPDIVATGTATNNVVLYMNLGAKTEK